jgi:hypothetical protein
VTPVLAYKSQTEYTVSLQAHDRDESSAVYPYLLKVTTVFTATSQNGRFTFSFVIKVFGTKDLFEFCTLVIKETADIMFRYLLGLLRCSIRFLQGPYSHSVAQNLG